MVPPDQNETLASRLRSGTQALHERVESLVGMPESIEAHIQVLSQFFGFLEPWETLVMPQVAKLHASLGDRRKVALVRNDLRDLGLSESAIADLPRCTALPDLHDLPRVLGSMYVFEGATLGGQILSLHVEKNLGLTNGVGYSYYKSYGPQVGQMWRNFKSVLQINIPGSSYDAAIESACETFEKLRKWFEESPLARSSIASQE